MPRRRTTGGVVSEARSRAAKVHVNRFHDCRCGKRCWGNGGWWSHRSVCPVWLKHYPEDARTTEHLRVALGARVGLKED